MKYTKKRCDVCHKEKRLALFSDSWLIEEYRKYNICKACMRKGFGYINEKLKKRKVK